MRVSPTSLRLLAVLVLLVGLSACTPPVHGPWVDSNGRQVSNAEILEFDGLNRCDQRSVVFFRLYDRQYAKDSRGVLGDLYSLDGIRLLTFEAGTDIPIGVEGTGFRHRDREIYVDLDTVEDYMYIVYDEGVVERWPRAEAQCT
jgi:hypothetical protein